MPSPFFLATKWDRCKIVLGIIVALAESIADPCSTIVVGRFFKDTQALMAGSIASQEFLSNVKSYSYALICITFYAAIVNAIGYALWVNIGFSLGTAARSRLYKALIEQNVVEFDSQNNLSGLAVMYFKDVQDIELAAGLTSYEIVAMGAGFFVEIGVAFGFSWAVTLVCLAGIPVVIFIGVVFQGPINTQITKSKSLLDVVSERVSWALGALETVKVFQREGFEWSTVHKKLSFLQQNNNRYWVLFKLQQGLSRSVVLMIFMQGFYFGSYMVKNHGLSAGDVVSVFWCCLNGTALLQMVLTHCIEWSKGGASAERLAKVLIKDEDEVLRSSIGVMPESKSMNPIEFDRYKRLGWQVNGGSSGVTAEIETDEAKTTLQQQQQQQQYNPHSLSHGNSSESTVFTGTKSPTPAPPSPSPASVRNTGIVFTDVVFSYPQRQEITLADLSMDFKSGTCTFVLGQSGCGKSTLASLVAKQYPWQAGEITIGGLDVHMLSNKWIEENVYVCDQNPKIFNISVGDNIKIGTKEHDMVSDSELSRAIKDSCSEFVYDLPNGLRSMGATRLSGGQKQRISIARARLSEYPIIIYDEVTSALDPELQAEVFQKMMSYRANKTTIIITHEHSIIPDGYPVYLMENGQAKFFETISDAMQSPEYNHRAAYKQGGSLQVSDRFSRGVNTDLPQNHYGESPAPSFTEKVLTYTDAVATECDDECTTAPGISAISRLGLQASLGNTKLSYHLFKSIPRKGVLLIGLACTAIHAIINPVFSFCFSKLIMGILEPDSGRETMWAMLVVMCAVLDGLAVISTVSLNFAAESWLRTFRERLFEKVLNSDDPIPLNRQSSYFTKLIISDSEKAAEVISTFWSGMLSLFTVGIAGFACALYFGWKLTLVCASLLPVFVLTSICYKLLVTRWNKKREELRASVVDLMTDFTSEAGFRTIKVQHLERYFGKIYKQREQALFSITSAMVSQLCLGYGLLKCFMYALEALLLWYGMRLIGKGEYTPQDTMSVFSFLMFTIITIDQLTSSIGSVGAGFEGLSRLLDATVTVRRKSRAERPFCTERIKGSKPEWRGIGFYGVSKKFGDGSMALDNFTNEVNDSETVAFIGPSGVGKSTLARMLICLETPSTGEIVIDGKWDLSNISMFDVRQNVGLVGQAPLDFFDGTIEDNLLYGVNASDARARVKMVDICKKCGAHSFISALKDQYDTRIKSGLLSGGQMQRLGIARALICEPKILILDECTSALDIHSKGIVKDLIADLRDTREMIIVIITHQMDVAQLADRIVTVG